MKQFLWLFSIILCLSCNRGSDTLEHNTKDNVFLKKTETIQVKIDSSISPFIWNNQYLWDEDILVFNNHNLNDNSLILLDLKSEKTSKISFEKEGVNELKNAIFNFYYHNSDNIFFLPMYAHKILVFDSLQNVKNKIEFKTGIENIGQTIVYMGQQNALFKNNKMVFTTFPTNANQMAKSINDPIFYELNFDDSIAKGLPYTYELNFDKNYPLQHPFYIDPRSVFDLDGNIIFTFPKSKKLFRADTKQITKSVDINSDYIDEYHPLKSMKDFGTHEITGNANIKLDYDKINKQIYLIAEMGISKQNGETGRLNEKDDKPFVVFVYDNDMNKILEQKFVGSKYKISASFVGQKGLYLSLNNKKNDSFDEDNLRFEIFKLTKK
ncbi:MAG: hypothetical protein U1E02_17730 [Hydrogenophaga sp.]|nr:hypothetical protein [Hydrogenophaga sp.]